MALPAIKHKPRVTPRFDDSLKKAAQPFASESLVNIGPAIPELSGMKLVRPMSSSKLR